MQHTNKYIIAGISFWLMQSVALAGPEDFDQAKKMVRKVYSDHPVTLYCGCSIKWTGGTSGKINQESCGYKVRKDHKRAARSEYEHIMPAKQFGQNLDCWRYPAPGVSGRASCKGNPEFDTMEGDMHNLAPAIGEVNNDRRDYKYGMVTGKSFTYGACEMKIDAQSRLAEPPDNVKGDVARVSLYMRDRYGISLSRAQEKTFYAWNKIDPVDKWELERDKRIASYMGFSNPYVSGGKLPAPRYIPPQYRGASETRQLQIKLAQVANNPADIGRDELYGIKENHAVYAPGCGNYEEMKSSGIAVRFEDMNSALIAGFQPSRTCPL